MAIQEILLLGNPKLYEVCQPVQPGEIESIKQIVQDLHDTMMDFRATYNAGRAIAAPQIGVMKQLVYMHIDSPVVFINPVIDQQSRETITLWDDCMSFPDLLVKLQRPKTCRITYRDLEWVEQSRPPRVSRKISSRTNNGPIPSLASPSVTTSMNTWALL